MKSRTLTCITAMALFAALVIPLQLTAQHTRYTVTDLGTLGGRFSFGNGINNRGSVEGGSTLLGDTAEHAFLWRKGVMTPLPTLGGNNGQATDVNNRGQVAGLAEIATPDPTCEPSTTGNPQVLLVKPVIWRNGSVQELPTFAGDPGGQAIAINDVGQAAGFSGSCTMAAHHALLWHNGRAIDLGNLGGTEFSAAGDINNQGQVVVASNLPGDTTAHSFLWQNGVMTDLGTLPGDVASTATGINSKGQVVGASFDINGNDRAFLWQNGVMTDLNTLIPADSPLFLIAALDNNSREQIAGVAVQTSTGEVHAFLATPSNGFAASENTTPAARGETTERPRVVLPENVRRKLRQRLGSRFHIPGLRGASLYQSLHGPSAEANTTLAPTAADSGCSSPLIDGVDWVNDHGTTFSNTPTGHCVAIPVRVGGPRLNGWCVGQVSGACHSRYVDGIQCPVHFFARRFGHECGAPVDLARFCTP